MRQTPHRDGRSARPPPAGLSRSLCLLTCASPGTPPLAHRLERAGLHITAHARWQDGLALAQLHSHGPALLLLDIPQAEEEAVPALVRAARLIAPIAVLPPTPACTLAAFAAGAVNVLDRSAPAAELTWRIQAGLHRLTAPATHARRISRSGVQNMLFDILTGARQPVCCHHLRLLMGSPDLPMTMRALKARIQRLHPAFHDYRHTLLVDQQWGLATFRTQPHSHPTAA
ncbi:hypothetical protein NJL88_29265 [Streptomyces sp. DK15]|uniref:hypothetical protein n=1 Tax=Streptomyces sp. DK15 TaxID=2957499 RepID=UPI0029BC3466|nr:hypothetical protein [Streptomyces sp. DK15]MDX2394079.1 hypothetical protein [Streptomyces sp. DK15]